MKTESLNGRDVWGAESLPGGGKKQAGFHAERSAYIIHLQPRTSAAQEPPLKLWTRSGRSVEEFMPSKHSSRNSHTAARLIHSAPEDEQVYTDQAQHYDHSPHSFYLLYRKQL